MCSMAGCHQYATRVELAAGIIMLRAWHGPEPVPAHGSLKAGKGVENLCDQERSSNASLTQSIENHDCIARICSAARKLSSCRLSKAT